jgi:hypothetical protein
MRWPLEQHPELSTLVSVHQRHDYLPWPRRHFQPFDQQPVIGATYWGALRQQEVQTEDTPRTPRAYYADVCVHCGHPRLTHEHPDGAGECTFTATPERSAFDSAPTTYTAMCPCIGGIYRAPWVDSATVYQQTAVVDHHPMDPAEPVSTGTSWQEQWPFIGATLDPQTGEPQPRERSWRPWDTLRAKVLNEAEQHIGGHARTPGVPDSWADKYRQQQVEGPARIPGVPDQGAHPVLVQVGGTEYQGILRDGVLHLDMPAIPTGSVEHPAQEEPPMAEPINLDDIANRWTIARYAGIDADDAASGWDDDAKRRALITSWQDVGTLIDEVRRLRTEQNTQPAIAWDKSAVKHIGWVNRMTKWNPDSGDPEPPAPENPYR